MLRRMQHAAAMTAWEVRYVIASQGMKMVDVTGGFRRQRGEVWTCLDVWVEHRRDHNTLRHPQVSGGFRHLPRTAQVFPDHSREPVEELPDLPGLSALYASLDCHTAVPVSLIVVACARSTIFVPASLAYCHRHQRTRWEDSHGGDVGAVCGCAADR
jgi:hypothetical protein